MDVRRLGTAYPSGVECAALAVKPADGCARLRVAAGTVLRLQRVVEIDNFGPVSRHYLRVVRACNTPCGSSERFCAASGTCLVDGKDHCLLCEGRKAAVCACRTGCEATSDGATCSFMESDDTGRGGTCHSGTCANP